MFKKENNENDMAAQVFWSVFHSSKWPSPIGPTADFDIAAIHTSTQTRHLREKKMELCSS